MIMRGDLTMNSKPRLKKAKSEPRCKETMLSRVLFDHPPAAGTRDGGLPSVEAVFRSLKFRDLLNSYDMRGAQCSRGEA
jgi:hypothetical protein